MDSQKVVHDAVLIGSGEVGGEDHARICMLRLQGA
jgi:hypothetical protein